MPPVPAHVVLRASLLLLMCVLAAACGRDGVFRPEYEYEEEVYLALDGSATVNVNASVPALIALRGADLNPDPRARLDRGAVRAMFSHDDADVRVSLSRRDGRRFVHVSMDVTDVRQVARVAPLSWSSYRFERRGDVFEYRQVVGPPSTREAAGIRWTGEELVNFKMHLPSEVVFDNSTSGVERGNILEWEQTLADRLQGVPVEVEVHLEPDSILYTTLLLFGGVVVAAALTFALLIWWVARRGRNTEIAESRP